MGDPFSKQYQELTLYLTLFLPLFRASGDGHARLSEPSLVSLEEAGPGVTNIKN
jgi:hypothetical protein